MEKLESSFKNMVLSLVTICLVAGGVLAGIYGLTKETIEIQKEQKLQAAILQVLPEGCTIADAELIKGMTVYKGYIDNQWVGTAVETTENGFGGPVKIMVGFDADSKVINYQVLEHQETPGLGDKMGAWFKTDKGNQSILGDQGIALLVVLQGSLHIVGQIGTGLHQSAVAADEGTHSLQTADNLQTAAALCLTEALCGENLHSSVLNVCAYVVRLYSCCLEKLKVVNRCFEICLAYTFNGKFAFGTQLPCKIVSTSTRRYWRSA